jgi:hypothetical protein
MRVWGRSQWVCVGCARERARAHTHGMKRARAHAACDQQGADKRRDIRYQRFGVCYYWPRRFSRVCCNAFRIVARAAGTLCVASHNDPAHPACAPVCARVLVGATAVGGGLCRGLNNNAIGGTVPASLSALTALTFLCAAPPRRARAGAWAVLSRATAADRGFAFASDLAAIITDFRGLAARLKPAGSCC